MHDNLGLALNNFAIMAVKTMRAFYASNCFTFSCDIFEAFRSISQKNGQVSRASSTTKLSKRRDIDEANTCTVTIMEIELHEVKDKDWHNLFCLTSVI